MEPKKESKKAACDVKVKLIKLGVALATRPVLGESLNRPDESKLSSARSLLSPSVVLRTPLRPAALSAALRHGWVREAGVADCDCL